MRDDFADFGARRLSERVSLKKDRFRETDGNRLALPLCMVMRIGDDWGETSMRKGIQLLGGRVWVSEGTGKDGEWMTEAEYRASGYLPEFESVPKLIVQRIGPISILPEHCDADGKVTLRNVVEPYSETPKYRCPCCRYLTLHQRAGFEYCPVCYWEDDGQDEHDADTVRGGPNGGLSLTRARENFAHYGACSKSYTKNVRPPTEGER